MRELMRRNVTDRVGTGRRADVPGLRVGGKTGTAELPGRGGYQRSAVIASFLGAFPMEAPRYLTLVMLFEPEAHAGNARPGDGGGQRRPGHGTPHRPHGAAARSGGGFLHAAQRALCLTLQAAPNINAGRVSCGSRDAGPPATGGSCRSSAP